MLAEVAKGLIRISSFVGKELREVVRRPGVLFSVVLGPFLIMLLFGLGYSGYRRPFATEIVIPPESGLPTDPGYYANLAPGRIDVVSIGPDVEAAEDRLRRHEVDVLVIAPSNAPAELRAGHQTTIRVAWNEVDPVYHSLAELATSILVSSLNASIIESAAAGGIAFAEAELGPAVSDLSPEVVANPTTAETENMAPTEPKVTSFFGSAVFALDVQHLAVTVTSLSVVRERLSGQIDRYRVAPVSSSELLLGKYVAYAVLSLLVAGAIGALLVGILGVPLLSGWPLFMGITLLLILASLGLGLLISLVADSERQAVQLAMLVLLASVFFSGFVLPIGDFADWMQPLAYLLPVTHGIATLQDAMLRGAVREPWMLLALGGAGVVLYLISLLRVRRLLRSAG